MTRVIRPDDGRTRIIRARGQSDDGLTDAVHTLSLALQQEQRRRDTQVDQLQTAAVDMAVMLAEQLLQARLAADRALILDLAAPMLAALRRANALTISACPEDAERLRQALRARKGAEPIIEVQDDPTLTAGSLRVDSDVGSLDGRLQVRLTRLAARLRTQPEESP